jgi:hypothetical protein
MEVADPPDPRGPRLLPLVEYAVERRIESGQPDYWDFASRLELAVIGQDEQRAQDALGDALAVLRARWEAQSTAGNLSLLREARERRGAQAPWATELEETLAAASPA